jgi:maltose-binding protein MalE
LVTVLVLTLLGTFPVAKAADAVTITICCKANVQGGEGWRCDNFSKAKDTVERKLNIQVTLNLIQDNKDWGEYKNEFVLASQAKSAPDIILSGHEDLGACVKIAPQIPQNNRDQSSSAQRY